MQTSTGVQQASANVPPMFNNRLRVHREIYI